MLNFGETKADYYENVKSETDCQSNIPQILTLASLVPMKTEVKSKEEFENEYISTFLIF